MKSAHYCAAKDLDGCQRVQDDKWLNQPTNVNFCQIGQGFQKFISAGMIPIVTSATKSERSMFKKNDKGRGSALPCPGPEMSAHGAAL